MGGVPDQYRDCVPGYWDGNRLESLVSAVGSESQMEALPIRTVVRDRNGDVFEKVAERGVEMTGQTGKWGLSWIAYPAQIIYQPEHS